MPGYRQFVELAGIFNRRLWDSFPFAAPDAATDATPDDLRAFYDAGFGNALILIDNLPAESTWFGDKKEAVQSFMRRMEEARVFFNPFSSASWLQRLTRAVRSAWRRPRKKSPPAAAAAGIRSSKQE